MNTEMVAPECIEKGDFIWSKQDVYEGRVKNNYSYLQPKTHADVKPPEEMNTTVWVFTLEHGPEFSFSSGEQVKRRRREW
ncbi:MAG: hypothetical protein WA317_15270 [Mycobacterium sp.]|uniref:hypothetical protein n=1 Tax=Mycobacterium sp. TaxID=1785 RepID=UPI003CC5D48F